MKNMRRPSGHLVALLLGAAVVAACSRTPDGGLPPTSSVTAANATAITYSSRAMLPAPNSAWEMVPGTLTARNPAGAVSLTIHYAPEYAARIRSARAAVVRAQYASGERLAWVSPVRLDERLHRATADLPAELTAGANRIELELGVDGKNVRLEDPGPRYWTGSSWSKTGKIVAGKKTLVLIHGIFSSVEESFTKSCPKQIADAGGFQQILGLDYQWYEPPKTEGPIFASFLKQIADAKVTDVTIQAHSYGSLVSLSAIPKVDPDLKIRNLVTLGGPLPLRGTPLANKENHWRMGLVLGLLDWYTDEPPSVVDRAYDSGMVSSLATNSNALQTILDDVKNMPDKPNFVQVAGTAWICLIPGVVSGCWYSEEKFKKVLIDGSGVELPWDGVVEKIAANSTDIPNATAKAFPLSHVDLQCDKSVIKWVGTQLASKAPLP